MYNQPPPWHTSNVKTEIRKRRCVSEYSQRQNQQRGSQLRARRNGRRIMAGGAGAGGPSDDELLGSQFVWDVQHQAPPTFTSHNPQTHTVAEEAEDANSIFSDSSLVDITSQHAEPEAEDVAASDFEDLGDDELPQLDGSREATNGYHIDQTGLRRKERRRTSGRSIRQAQHSEEAEMEGPGNHEYDQDWPQAGPNADAVDLAGPGLEGSLNCQVTKPQKEGEGTQNTYITYLVTTDTDFKSYQSTHSSVRRRFKDFDFLHKMLGREYPQCAIPPIPDKQQLSYVRGDRFGSDFINRRAFSLSRFLKRLTLHPVLRRAAILTLFLESIDWNGVMKGRSTRGMSGSESGSGSVLETWTDSFLNAFTKPHKTDKKFQDVGERANKLDDDLGTVSKTVARVAKREGDLEADYADLAVQFQKLAALEPGVQDELTKFAASVHETSGGWRDLKEHTDQDYLSSLHDMEAYIKSIKSLLKTREQKQLDFEGLTEYLNKAAQERDTLASHGSMGASGFLRQKIEDVRGVDHEQSRRERQRKLEVQISRLTTEVEAARKTSQAFDSETMKEVGDFERIKAHEFRDTLGGLAEANIAFFEGNILIWEKFVKEMEKAQAQAQAQEGAGAAQ
ncbi:intercellular trafficking and secretion [Recurvomyces mirabilis]|uniref:Sorting nexin-4 n=1 Tax=Recurvomyces mirabilis TaxID=574656 RepID=A0AAE0WPX8_9PEZI|nr:intercellular trafficking and secretion [Recurvomyces mirabilis]KAK5155968.1 intercellular trafficking and secretion [Recurvomyces mirabilis]